MNPIKGMSVSTSGAPYAVTKDVDRKAHDNRVSQLVDENADLRRVNMELFVRYEEMRKAWKTLNFLLTEDVFHTVDKLSRFVTRKDEGR